MSLQALSDYTIISRYSSYLKDKKRRETWGEMTDRVFQMHAEKYKDALENPEFVKEFEFAHSFVKKKRVLGSQRALQFGGDPIFKHPAKIYNCLSEETEFVTSTGVKSFLDFNDGDDVIVPTHTGNWKHAKVKSYGQQKLYEIGIRRGKATHTVFATENHRWLLDDGSETTKLKVGDSLLAASNIFSEFDYDNATPFEKLYWCYGYVFGDGTKVKRNGQYEYTMVRLCGDDIKYERRFVEMGFKTSSSLSLGGDIMCYTGKYLKNAPDPTQDSVEQIRAFVHGYLSADGAKNKNPEKISPFISIQSSDIDHIEFIRECFPMVGMYIISERNLTGQVTNFATRPYTVSFKINNSTGRENKYSSKFNVEYIKDSGRFERVWCLEVEDDHSLVLPFGMVTGNCSYGYIDRVAAFSEAMYLLLCGCGVGFSVQKKHMDKLPDIKQLWKGDTKTYTPEDSIEGWSECVRVLVESYFDVKSEYHGYDIYFDLSNIRPEGAMIAGRFKAPGPEGLRTSLEKMKQVFENRLALGETKLHAIDVYDLIMHASDAVLSGGVRRSATICLFSKDDPEMMSAKTGDWFIKNPQRGRSNNSVLLLKDEISREDFAKIMKSTREFGEPGFVFSDSEDIGYNPCFTIDTKILTDGGWRSFENLLGKDVIIEQDGRVTGFENGGKEEWIIDNTAPATTVKNKATNIRKTAENQKVFSLNLRCGRSVKATDNHHFATKRGMVELKNLTNDDEILIPVSEVYNSSFNSDEYWLGYLAGMVYGDGNVANHGINIDVWTNNESDAILNLIENKIAYFIEKYKDKITNRFNTKLQPKFTKNSGALIGTVDKYRITSSALEKIFILEGINGKNNGDWIHGKDKEFKSGFISAMFYCDGHTEYNNKSKTLSIRLTSIEFDLLKNIQLVLQELGIFSRINTAREAGQTLLPDTNRDLKLFNCKKVYRLMIGGKLNCLNSVKCIDLHDKDKKRIEYVVSVSQINKKCKFYSKVDTIQFVGIEDVYCLTENNRRTLIAEGITARRCVEIGMYPQTEDGRSGWQFCNLCEINGKYCDTVEKFYDCCKAAAILGTMQSGYTQFTYLAKETQEITEREALLGCSITGIMDNPDILLDSETQRNGAYIVKDTNKRITKMIGIRPAARTTAVKPAGSTSCVLSTGSGIHPHHAKRYIRRVQANRAEFPLQHFQKINPLAVEKSVWSANGTDYVISFLCEVPKTAITKNKMGAVELLKKVQLTQQNWVESGTNLEYCVVPYVRHNVSNTITVKEDEWQDIEDYIYDNRKWFAGISLLPASGDLDYPQAPFTSVLDAKELVEEYGEGSLMASGLIVDGLAAFNNNLWAACDSLNGIGEVVSVISEPVEPAIPSKNKTKADLENVLDYYNCLELYEKNFKKLDWLRRSRQFAERYFDGNIKKMCHCLKHVYTFKQWIDLKREYVEIDWSEVIEEDETFIDANTMGGAACSGGKCELI